VPSLESAQVARHILKERLFKVAAHGETFQDEELQHLENCVLCQQWYMQFVQRRLKDCEIEALFRITDSSPTGGALVKHCGVFGEQFFSNRKFDEGG
jgi:hypothetical protein